MSHLAPNQAFQDLRNYLAGRALGISRDSSLMHEIVKCMFCLAVFPDLPSSSDAEGIANTYREAFRRLVKLRQTVFKSNEELLLDPNSIAQVDAVLRRFNYDSEEQDPLSELYQVFVSNEVRGREGQFFTPTEAVRWLVDAIDPKAGEKIIDPACGAGSFLSYSARHLRAQGADSKQIVASLHGIEKDRYLADLANTHIALTSIEAASVVCADSIERRTEDGKPIPFKLDGQFDVVLTNPPFGAKIKIGSDSSLRSFDLAYKWSRKKGAQLFTRTDELAKSPTPQILFLELCIRLLKEGGRMGLVLPESMISNTASGYVVQYLMEHTDLESVIGMPESLFKTSGRGGTHTKTCLVIARRRETRRKAPTIFMAEAKWCGHDSRGNKIPRNDMPKILENFRKKKIESTSNLGYRVKQDEISNFVLAPRYYEPSSALGLSALAETHNLLLIKDLVDTGVLEFSTGTEVGKLAYGTGDIPFVRTSDISNWEIKLDAKHGVSEEIYQSTAAKLDVREGDILMVRDGTYLIGTCGYISKYDERIVYQSHIYKIRTKNRSVISPFLLLAALSSKPVIAQIQSKRYTQDIIDTLGNRVLELVLPIPKDAKKRAKIEKMVEQCIYDRIEARELARSAREEIVAV